MFPKASRLMTRTARGSPATVAGAVVTPSLENAPTATFTTWVPVPMNGEVAMIDCEPAVISLMPVGKL